MNCKQPQCQPPPLSPSTSHRQSKFWMRFGCHKLRFGLSLSRRNNGIKSCITCRQRHSVLCHLQAATQCVVTYRRLHNVLYHVQTAVQCVVSLTDGDIVCCHLQTATQCVVSRTDSGTVCCITYRQRHSVLRHVQTATQCAVSRTDSATQCVVSRTDSGTLRCVTYRQRRSLLCHVLTTRRQQRVGSKGTPGAEITQFLPRDTDRMPCCNITAFKGRYLERLGTKEALLTAFIQSSPVVDRVLFLCCFSFNPQAPNDIYICRAVEVFNPQATNVIYIWSTHS